jgi:GNAT superfamily N-acetyltransferase
VKVTIEHKMSEAAVSAFYPVYVAAFDPIRTRAAARHLLAAEEFEAEMVDERIDKYVVWEDNGEPVALTTLATDLDAVPWISPEYFAARYPDQLARGAVFYLGYTLVRPEYAQQGVFQLMTDAVEQRAAESQGVLAFDVCAYNNARSVGRRVGRLGESVGVSLDAVDVQTYYAATFDAPLRAGAAV